MVKKVSLAIADEVYEKLAVLSSYYNEDVQDAIKELLETIGMESRWIMKQKDDYKVPVNLKRVLSDIIHAAYHSLGLFNEVLEKLDVKGLYKLEDFEFNLDERYMRFFYDAVTDDLKIHAFDIILQNGSKHLTTFTYIEVGENEKRALESLKDYIQAILGELDQLPEEFEYAEDYNIEIIEEEELWTLQIDCIADSFDDFPSIKRMSNFVKQIFKKVGIKA